VTRYSSGIQLATERTTEVRFSAGAGLSHHIRGSPAS